MKNSVFIAAKARLTKLFVAILCFSVAVNLLMLTGSVYMLQVYNRVLPGRSENTLIALTIIMVFFYVVTAAIDGARSKIATRAGARLQSDLDDAVFVESMRRTSLRPGDPSSLQAQKDLENIARTMASPVFLTMFDIPWIPLFLGVIFIMHPILGVVGTVGGAVLIVFAILGHIGTSSAAQENMQLVNKADRLSNDINREGDLIQGLGMREHTIRRWRKIRGASILSTIALSDRMGFFSNFSKYFRQILQSVLLAASAWLVIKGEMHSGEMMASSILMGRALAPVDAAIGQWSTLQRARQSWGRINSFMAQAPEVSPLIELPRPRAVLNLQSVTTGPSDRSLPVLRAISFSLHPGQALAVVGPSGSGKSSLARLLIGNWKPYVGAITLDAAPMHQYDPDVLGSYFGYLPQSVRLLEGTIAENISRFDPEATSESIIKAARIAGVHEMIVSLLQGYNTKVLPDNPELSGGQMQRIGLARAVYGTPVILVLDEPNSNMDSEGSMMLNRAIKIMKSLGSAVIVMAHRPSAIAECDMLLVLSKGAVQAFGPKSHLMSADGTINLAAGPQLVSNPPAETARKIQGYAQ